MRAKITKNPNGSVTVERDSEISDERFTSDYFVTSSDGLGYVKYQDKSGNTHQICDGMSSTGETLMASKDSLLDVLKKNLRKQREREKKGY